METKERIEVYIDYKNGDAACICKRSKKMCNKKCTPDVVERDRFDGWQDTFKVSKYGKAPHNIKKKWGD